MKLHWVHKTVSSVYRLRPHVSSSTLVSMARDYTYLLYSTRTCTSHAYFILPRFSSSQTRGRREAQRRPAKRRSSLLPSLQGLCKANSHEDSSQGRSQNERLEQEDVAVHAFRLLATHPPRALPHDRRPKQSGVRRPAIRFGVKHPTAGL